MWSIDTKFPVDSLILTEKYIISGSYMYSEGKREGEITYYDLELKNETKLFKTSGTFNIKQYDEMLIAANASDISIIINDKVNKIDSSMNTDIEYEKNIFTTTDDGNIQKFDFCNLLKQIKISNEVLWTIKSESNIIYTGGDDSILYFFDVRDEDIKKIYKKEGVLTCIEKNDNYLFVGGYDGMVDIIDIRTHSIVNKIKTGALWRIKKREKYFVAACMYEGIKLYSLDWDVAKVNKTESICYDGNVFDNKIVFSSFYDKKIFIDEIDKDYEILNS